MAIDEDDWSRMMQAEHEWCGAPVVIGKQHIRCHAILTADEVEILKGYPGNTTVLLHLWGLRLLRNSMKRAGCNENVYVNIEDTVLKLRRACAFISNQLAMPVRACRAPPSRVRDDH